MLEFMVYPKETPWLLYTRTGCGSCANAKDALENRLFAYKLIVSPDDPKKKAEMLESLASKTRGQKTFPIVFHKKNKESEYRFVGGWDNLQHYLVNL
jgi:glutaredoxin